MLSLVELTVVDKVLQQRSTKYMLNKCLVIPTTEGVLDSIYLFCRI